MTNKGKETMQKVWWFIIPTVFSFFVWLTITTFNTQTTLQVIQTQGNERSNMQEKIYNRVEDVSHQLQTKLDITDFNIKHKELEDKVDKISVKVDKIYNRRSNYTNFIDTLYTLPKWDPNELVRNFN